MIKKIICLGTMLSMMFLLMGCYQGNKLEKYKATAKTTIKTYVESKEQDIYNEENRTILSELVKEGNTVVDKSLNKTQADYAIATAKQEIDEVSQMEEEIDLQIRRDYLRDLHARGKTNFTLDDVNILRNYGIYGKSIVVKMNRGAYLMLTTLIVAEVTFYFEDSNTALVWRDRHFFELEEAYNLGLLSKADLIIIANIQNSKT